MQLGTNLLSFNRELLFPSGGDFWKAFVGEGCTVDYSCHQKRLWSVSRTRQSVDNSDAWRCLDFMAALTDTAVF